VQKLTAVMGRHRGNLLCGAPAIFIKVNRLVKVYNKNTVNTRYIIREIIWTHGTRS